MPDHVTNRLYVSGGEAEILRKLEECGYRMDEKKGIYVYQ